MSGSPLFLFDENQKKALVVGVHVGGSKTIANTAVPISYHKGTTEEWSEKSSSRGNTFETMIPALYV